MASLVGRMQGVRGFATAVVRVLSGASLIAWLVSIVASRQPLNLWLVATLALLLVAAVLWGIGRGTPQVTAQQVTHHHYYTGSVTWHSDLRPDAPALESVGPSSSTGVRELVLLSDYVEFPPDGPPIIRNRQFRNAVIRGPILLALRRVDFTRVAFGIAEGGPETMFWPLPPGVAKVAAAVVDNCIFEDCETEQVGFVGTRDELDKIRRRIDG